MTADQQTLVEPLLLSADETAKILGISIRLLQSLNSSGRLPLPVRLGRRTLWAADELRAWIVAGAPSREKWVQIRRSQNV
jgi:predicted DNA-binding transcriptional regulator AlpA